MFCAIPWKTVHRYDKASKLLASDFVSTLFSIAAQTPSTSETISAEIRNVGAKKIVGGFRRKILSGYDKF
jgi:hypothetical protein